VKGRWLQVFLSGTAFSVLAIPSGCGHGDAGTAPTDIEGRLLKIGPLWYLRLLRTDDLHRGCRSAGVMKRFRDIGETERCC
jgi:hypothetical protein